MIASKKQGAQVKNSTVMTKPKQNNCKDKKRERAGAVPFFMYEFESLG